MRITQEADYAIRIACTLAECADKRVGASDISELTKVPPRFTLSILRKMVISDIVISYKGKNGGYVLARPSTEVTLKDVIEAIDGPIAISKCIDKDHECSKLGLNKRGCRVHNIFVEINSQVSEKLSRVSIHDAIDKTIPLSDIFELIK